ncbi:MAG: hypothetical protein VX228_10725 [Pseudomonadota bacterium]|nr:hypothetical protein [Pseudomonadota bacterium]
MSPPYPEGAALTRHGSGGFLDPRKKHLVFQNCSVATEHLAGEPYEVAFLPMPFTGLLTGVEHDTARHPSS